MLVFGRPPEYKRTDIRFMIVRSLRPVGLNRISDHPLFLRSGIADLLAASPMGFVDIGARGGVHELVEPLARHTAVLGFEPDETECLRLMTLQETRANWAAFHLEPIALSDKKGMAEFHLCTAATNHSLLPPNPRITDRYRMDKFRETGRETLKADTLDSVLARQHRGGPSFCADFLKLDTQGSEHEVLTGAAKTLDEVTLAVVTEVSFCEIYAGQRLFSEVEMLLRKHHFSFYGFSAFHSRSRKFLDKLAYKTAERALYADAVFFKDALDGTKPAEEFEVRQLAVLFTCATLLGYYDYALELVRDTPLKTSARTRDALEKLIREFANLPIEESVMQLDQLVETVRGNRQSANIVIGGFVDSRRQFCDYDDVLNVSPLPRTV